ncbi:hypothetical protein FACS1894171_2130 [Clostridia bacterium]|nr:hypothetical protein FACS1894171_2130 [Clostridia bacterium]
MNETHKCPVCGQESKQVNNGHNRSGAQRVLCRHCRKVYTLEPKQHEISEEIREQSIKMYYSGVSGRGVGGYFGMDKSNVYNWIKKKTQIMEDDYQILELDELYWFVERKGNGKTRENVYIITLVSRKPHQIVGFDVALDKSRDRIQALADAASETKRYCTDGY